MKVIDEFHVRNKAEMYERLEAGIAVARNHALADGTCGLLVTRHEFDRFSIALSPAVPFGLVSEVDKAS